MRKKFDLSARVVAAVAVCFAVAAPSAATAHARDPLRIDVPSLPRLANSTSPVLYQCADLEDCQAQAAAFCETFEYPKGKILFKELPREIRPFPIYSVICFE